MKVSKQSLKGLKVIDGKTGFYISNSANGCREGAVLAVNEWAISTYSNAIKVGFMSQGTHSSFVPGA